MKMDPYCQRRKCRPIILVSRKIRYRPNAYMRVFAGVPPGGVRASNDSAVVDDGIIVSVFSGYLFRTFRQL